MSQRLTGLIRPNEQVIVISNRGLSFKAENGTTRLVSAGGGLAAALEPIFVHNYFGEAGKALLCKPFGDDRQAMRKAPGQFKSVSAENGVHFVDVERGLPQHLVDKWDRLLTESDFDIPFTRKGTDRAYAIGEALDRFHYLGISSSLMWPVMHGNILPVQPMHEFLGGRANTAKDWSSQKTAARTAWNKFLATGEPKPMTRLTALKWEAYRDVNQLFADRAAERLEKKGPGVVLVQDYHFLLAGAQLLKRHPDAQVALFMHTPFAEPAEFAYVPPPIRSEILTAMSKVNVGFHSRQWELNYTACVHAFLQPDVPPRTYVSPLGPEPDDVQALVANADPQVRQRIRDWRGQRTMIARSDRMEPSKNVIASLDAFEEVLERKPDLRGSVVFWGQIYASREDLRVYLDYGSEVLHRAKAINDRWRNFYDGQDCIDIDTSNNKERAMVGLSMADVIVINPLRDGMNLVVKEAARVNDRAVTIISNTIGAFEELGQRVLPDLTEFNGNGHDERAILDVDPTNSSELADRFIEAIGMSRSERALRAAKVRELASHSTPLTWLEQQIEAARGNFSADVLRLPSNLGFQRDRAIGG